MIKILIYEKRSSIFVDPMPVSSGAPGALEKPMGTTTCGIATTVALISKITAASILTTLSGHTSGAITKILLIV
ncbi:uncharacterized protein N7469_002090 [Penicillium citrinum]|uniref:Uncharacterized protein n=1 Tax=Penicillium citrinum TaxID=5077 RepID=A0A9W9P9M4_PENCI|nr:uncharacterized protein N7469_002090 [Penicillium citrinum]KAJ5240499.1 hypothetical protein N7469_002090 [Penicillium citrinum]